ncbi:MAG: prephenate dehydrogenase/arogenate dehydrogenase family protein [Dehalococcoidia bacterium]|nr:prephenate dehydrogenase/arogenate dehydrogenase family protein [Dehalococcoidia bacterium]
MTTIKRIAIIGLGLIGGSLGLALKQAKDNDLEIIGFARRPETAAEALKRGAVDKTEPTLSKAVASADIVIVATPILVLRDIFGEIAPHLQPGTIVSDVGSTKVQIMQWAKELLPSEVSFIGGHPMAGKETTGIEVAEAGLFKESVYCLTPSPTAKKESVQTMQELVISIGARLLFIEAKEHDKLVAGISHLPLVISSALVSTLGRDPSWADMSKLAATGYRDTSRLASGSSELNTGICLTNQEALARWLDQYIEELQEYRRLIAEGNPDLEKSFRKARNIRLRWQEKEGNRFK